MCITNSAYIRCKIIFIKIIFVRFLHMKIFLKRKRRITALHKQHTGTFRQACDSNTQCNISSDGLLLLRLYVCLLACLLFPCQLVHDQWLETVPSYILLPRLERHLEEVNQVMRSWKRWLPTFWPSSHRASTPRPPCASTPPHTHR